MLTCEICGKECKTRQGLIAHRRLAHLVVSGGRSGGDRSGQGSVNGGDGSGEWSGHCSEGEKAAAAVVAVVAGDQSMGEGSDEDSVDCEVHRILQGWIRQHEETGELPPEALDLVGHLVRELVTEEWVGGLVREEMRKGA